MLVVDVLLQHLTILNLHENKIKELPHGIGDLVNLTTLDVSHNHLESLPEGQSRVVDVVSMLILVVDIILWSCHRLIILRFSHSSFRVIRHSVSAAE